MVIDQVLGVEGASLDVPIEQIPYAKVPVPYSDQLVLPQPSRGLIHPDDAPPVLANLNAMPSSGALQAEELHSTDHALNVNMVGGGGGAAAASACVSYPLNATSGGNQHVADIGIGGSKIYLIAFTLVLWGASTAGDGNLFFYLFSGGSNSHVLSLFSLILPGAIMSVKPALIIERTYTFSEGLDVSAVLPLGGDYGFELDSPGYPVRGNLVIYSGN